jgi:hypothetical protein
MFLVLLIYMEDNIDFRLTIYDLLYLQSKIVLHSENHMFHETTAESLLH